MLFLRLPCAIPLVDPGPGRPRDSRALDLPRMLFWPLGVFRPFLHKLFELWAGPAVLLHLKCKVPSSPQVSLSFSLVCFVYREIPRFEIVSYDLIKMISERGSGRSSTGVRKQKSHGGRNSSFRPMYIARGLQFKGSSLLTVLADCSWFSATSNIRVNSI